MYQKLSIGFNCTQASRLYINARPGMVQTIKPKVDLKIMPYGLLKALVSWAMHMGSYCGLIL